MDLPESTLLARSPKRLLVVDDQAINVQNLYQIFEADHEIFVATSGEQALEFCATELPDLILLDIMMPGIDGHEVCRRLKKNDRTKDVPIIFVTAQNDPDQEAKGFELGAVDFITKPINATVVRARVRTHLTLKAQSDILRSLAFIDGLTGIANRRHFDDQLAIEWSHCQRRHVPLTLIMIDIDHFKHYNDFYGHQAGDNCLKAVAECLRHCFGRAHDLVARYGGEEFVCLLPDCTTTGAQQKAEELRTAIAALGIAHEASATANTVTISLGSASIVPGESIKAEQLVAAADAALYQAKSSGRNQAHAVELDKP